MFAECVNFLTAEHGLVASLFLGGLVGSFTHCAGMCAPFVLAQTQDGPFLSKPATSLLLPYHLGRMTTYVALGVLVYGVVNLAYLFSGARALITAPLLMISGVLFLVSAFPRLAPLFPWAGRLPFTALFDFINTKATGLFRGTGALSRYGLGVLLGFIPCGLVLAALMASATAHSLPQAALAMAAFAVGTMPSLVMIGLCGKGLKQKFPVLYQRFTTAAMVMSSLWLFTLAGMLIF